MRVYDFDLALATPDGFDAASFLDRVEGPLFALFGGDVTPGVLCGVPYLACTVEAETMETAVQAVLPCVAELGLAALRAEFPVHA